MTQGRVHFTLLVSVLIAAGIGSIVYQAETLRLPLDPTASENIWTIEARISFDPRPGTPIKARLFVPPRSERFVRLDETFVSRNYGVSVAPRGRNRETTWSIRRAAGRQTLYYRVALAEQGGEPADDAPERRYVEPPALEGAEQVAIQALLGPIRRESADVKTFTAAAIRRVRDRDDDNARRLLGEDRSPGRIAAVTALVLGSAHIPARIVNAIPLQDATEVEPQVFLASFNGQEWTYYDPRSGRPTNMEHYLTWWEGDAPLLSVEGAKGAQLSLSASSGAASAIYLAQVRAEAHGSRWLEFSLSSLPLQTQQLYQVVLMLPVGVAIIVLLRCFVGIDTFGTFMPALIALAFRETDLGWGILLFGVLISLGMAIRAYLEHLRLLLVARLAIVLTTVVLIMSGISIVTYKLGFDRGLSIALFPMVVVTMTIERMSILWEERGGATAILVAIGSLFAAAVAYLVMTDPTLTHIVFTFPGVLLVVMAVVLLAGRYRGHRLAELWRFRALAEN